MKKNYKFLFAALLLFGASYVAAQVNGTATTPVVSTSSNPIYYYIESAANGTVATGGKTLNGLGKVIVPNASGAKMACAALPSTLDNALWAIINDAGVLKLYNKGTGFYMSLCHTAGTTQVGYAFTLIKGTTKQYTMFNDAITSQSRTLAWNSTAGATTPNVIDRWSSSQGANSMDAWYFILPSTNVDLAINNANYMLSFTTAGTQPGQYTSSARTTLQGAIDAAIAVRDNPASTQTDKDNAAATLNTAIDTYSSSKVALAKDGTKWYFVKGQRGSTSTALFAENQGTGNQILNKDKAFSNAQAWKIVVNGTEFALQNKQDNSYLNSDLAVSTNLSTVATAPTKGVVFYERGLDGTDKIGYFHIENQIPEPNTTANSAATTFRLHAGGSANNFGLVNYFNNTTSSTALYDNTLFQLIEAPATANATNSPANGTVTAGSTITLTSASGGTIYYTTDGATPTTSSSSVSSGSTITVPSTSSSLTVKTLAVADNSFPSDVVTSTYTVKLGTPTISPNGASNITAATQTVTLAMAESTPASGEKIYYTTNGDTPTSSSTEYTAPFDVTHNTTVKAISIAAGYTDSDVASADFGFTALNWMGNSYMTIGTASGTWYHGSGSAHTAFDGADLGTPTSLVLGGEVQVYPKTAEGVSMGYNLDGGTALYVNLPKTDEVGNNSKHYAETTVDISALAVGSHTLAVWFKAVRDGVTIWDSNNSKNYTATFNKTATGIHNTTGNSYTIRVNKGFITVDGTDNFDVYSLTGQKQNVKTALKAGAYIVKIKDFTQKVIVK